MNIQKLENNSDRIGVAGSFLCLVHCLFLPLFMTVATGFEELLHEYFKDVVIDSIFIGIALIAVYFSSKNTKLFPIKVLLWGFMLAFIAGIFLKNMFSYGSFLAFGGSIGLIISHLLNLRISKLKTRKALVVENV